MQGLSYKLKAASTRAIKRELYESSYPLVHSIFTLLLIKQIFEQIRSLRAAPEIWMQFWRRNTPKLSVMHPEWFPYWYTRAGTQHMAPKKDNIPSYNENKYILICSIPCLGYSLLIPCSSSDWGVICQCAM